MNQPDPAIVDRDGQFESYKIKTVTAETSGERPGWLLDFEEGSAIWCPAALCQQAPVPGETARLYGQGFGYAVRGIAIDGRVYRYLTEEEQEAEHTAHVDDERAKRQAELERELPDRDRRRAALPEPFRLRIEGFIAARPDWRRDHEGYELFCCEEAALIAGHFAAAGGDADALITAFRTGSTEEQKQVIPGLRYDEHSGNTWGCSNFLAQVYLANPEILPKVHGALCPIVGCQEYGCYASRAEAKLAALFPQVQEG